MDFKDWLNRLWKPAPGRPKWMNFLPIALLGVIVIGFVLMGGPATRDESSSALVNSSPLFFLDVFVKLFVVLMLVFISAYFLRRWQAKRSGAPDKKLAVLETVRLSPRQAIHLVRAGEQVFLVGATDQNLNLISALTSAEAPQPKPVVEQTPGFMNFLSASMSSNDLAKTASGTVSRVDEK